MTRATRTAIIERVVDVIQKSAGRNPNMEFRRLEAVSQAEPPVSSRTDPTDRDQSANWRGFPA
jgi:hypothetical protein